MYVIPAQIIRAFQCYQLVVKLLLHHARPLCRHLGPRRNPLRLPRPCVQPNPTLMPSLCFHATFFGSSSLRCDPCALIAHSLPIPMKKASSMASYVKLDPGVPIAPTFSHSFSSHAGSEVWLTIASLLFYCLSLACSVDFSLRAGGFSVVVRPSSPRVNRLHPRPSNNDLKSYRPK